MFEPDYMVNGVVSTAAAPEKRSSLLMNPPNKNIFCYKTDVVGEGEGEGSVGERKVKVILIFSIS